MREAHGRKSFLSRGRTRWCALDSFYIILVMRPIRTRFAKDIVTEFLPPSGKKRRGDRVVILCGGMPGMPKSRGLEFFARKGYWAFLPRYRGSWESGGRFLRISPEKDIKDVMDGVYRPFRDAMTGKVYRVRPREIVLIGSSFGGPAALLNSKDKSVSKVIALSPVVDWTDPSREERMDMFWKVVRDAFGEAYRFDKKDWDRLARGEFYNPATELRKIDAKKIFVFHTKDDYAVEFPAVKKFTEKIGAQSFFLARGGHLASKALFKKAVWRRVAAFLKS